jgi:hypothetical protein
VPAPQAFSVGSTRLFYSPAQVTAGAAAAELPACCFAGPAPCWQGGGAFQVAPSRRPGALLAPGAKLSSHARPPQVNSNRAALQLCQKWQTAARLFWYSSLEELATITARVPAGAGGLLARTDMQCTAGAGRGSCSWQGTGAAVAPELLKWAKEPFWAFSDMKQGAQYTGEVQVYLLGQGSPSLGLYTTLDGVSAAVLCRA